MVEVIAFALEERPAALLVDTAVKNGCTLFSCLSPKEAARLVAAVRGQGIPVALAGSLTIQDVPRILQVAPDWLAVRAAACVGGRSGTVSAARVRRLASLIQSGNRLAPAAPRG
jgi:uncharacterized protein (UPF0264 family)